MRKQALFSLCAMLPFFLIFFFFLRKRIREKHLFLVYGGATKGGEGRGAFVGLAKCKSNLTTSSDAGIMCQLFRVNVSRTVLARIYFRQQRADIQFCLTRTVQC